MKYLSRYSTVHLLFTKCNQNLMITIVIIFISLFLMSFFFHCSICSNEFTLELAVHIQILEECKGNREHRNSMDILSIVALVM